MSEIIIVQSLFILILMYLYIKDTKALYHHMELTRTYIREEKNAFANELIGWLKNERDHYSKGSEEQCCPNKAIDFVETFKIK